MALRLINTVSISVAGDGTSTSLTFDITKGPLNINVGGNNPIGITAGSGFPAGSSISLNGTKVTLTFANASDIPASGLGLNFNLLYPGE